MMTPSRWTAMLPPTCNYSVTYSRRPEALSTVTAASGAAQKGQRHVHHVLAPILELFLRDQVAPEDGRQGPAVGQVEESERRDRHIYLDRVQVGAEDPLLHPALEQHRDPLDQGRIQLEDAGRALQELRPVQVLGVQQAQE